MKATVNGAPLPTVKPMSMREPSIAACFVRCILSVGASGLSLRGAGGRKRRLPIPEAMLVEG